MGFADYLVAVPLGLVLGISGSGPVAGGVFATVQSSTVSWQVCKV